MKIIIVCVILTLLLGAVFLRPSFLEKKAVTPEGIIVRHIDPSVQLPSYCDPNKYKIEEFHGRNGKRYVVILPHGARSWDSFDTVDDAKKHIADHVKQSLENYYDHGGF